MITFALFLLGLVNPIHLRIAFTGEIAGYFHPRPATFITRYNPPLLGGYRSLKVLLEKLRKNNGYHFLLVDAGGISGGNILGENRNIDETARIINELGYNFINIGVRELFNGLDELKTLKERVKTTFLSSNLVVTEPSYQNLFKPYQIINLTENIKIGFFGILNENTPLFLREEVKKGFIVEKALETCQKMVDLLKDSGATVIILLSNMGYHNDTIIAKSVRGIDVIIGSFEGIGLRTPYESPLTHTIVVRTYNMLSEVGILDLFMSPNNGKIIRYEYLTETIFLEKYPHHLLGRRELYQFSP